MFRFMRCSQYMYECDVLKTLLNTRPAPKCINMKKQAKRNKRKGK